VYLSPYKERLILNRILWVNPNPLLLVFIILWVSELESPKRLYRSRNRWFAGVCGGIAEYLNVDPIIIRIIWLLLSLAYGVGVLAYIIAWILIPQNPYSIT
jgi:phage shock protein PspC (stress-responsive transcriptional regulator)